ncbi:hypothetical protein EYF80_030077 [Liparis tanakae]|uniref:Uncharacterized protein n=1 Tax=Liparis tanakae TaxID=230148 RepID=A0A4Z2H1Q9_9TELE|nr:hypothetical protein EYF80_030077 [Liparis tanakae]
MPKKRIIFVYLETQLAQEGGTTRGGVCVSVWGYCTFSLGRRLMVLSGRSTRRTLRDLMVLMSLPFVPLQTEKATAVI